jgi:TfoX/Sxy family transcriptional regulator of competence genes
MATDASFVQFVVDQLERAGEISSRKMFGEYALYCNTKVVALICDNKLFVKPTDAGRKFIGDPVEAPAFPGAKPSFLIEDKLEDRKWLTELIRITEKEVPAPKPKKKKDVQASANAINKSAKGASIPKKKNARR